MAREILVTYRQDDVDSELLADYYLSKYDLDGSYKIALPCGTDEILDDYSEFRSQVEDAIKSELDSSTQYIMLGLNIPGGFIDNGDVISSTSRISRINHTYTKKVSNPLYDRKDKLTYDSECVDVALAVGRIDGPNLEYAQNIIDSNATLENQIYMNGTFVFDPYSDFSSTDADTYRDELLYFYDNVLQEANVPFISTSIADAYFDPVIPYLQHESMYWGWFTDRSTETFFRDTDTQRIFFYNADFDSAFDVRDTPTERWCGLALDAGYSSCAGALSDPTIEGFLRPTPFIRSLINGFSLAESFTMASPFLDWTIAFFGDPLVGVTFRYENPQRQNVDWNEHWRAAATHISKSIANHYAKKLSAENILNEIVASSDVDLEVATLYQSHDLYNTSLDSAIKSLFNSSAGSFLTIPITAYGYSDIDTYLTDKNYQISRLLISVVGSGVSGISANNIHPIGYWEYEYTIQDEHPGTASNYYFEVSVSTDSSFSDIVAISKSDESINGWSYEMEPNEYIDVPSGGVPSGYIGRIVRYKSLPSQYLTRGSMYYFRIIQKDRFGYYSYKTTQEIIWT